MAALIDIEAPDTQLLSRPQLSQDTLAAMVLLYEGALEITSINTGLQPGDGGTALGARYPKASISDSSTLLSQLFTHSVTMDFEPTLSTRSSDKVIEELKRGRYQRQKIHSSLVANNSLSNIHQNVSSIPGPSQPGGNDEEAEDVESELEEVLVPQKPRKISERKRIQNAAQESWFQSYQRQQAKAASNISNVDTEALSIRYLVRQAESQRIISSPREYQVELFERAKEQNIIAVLDTGKPYLSWS